LNVGVNALPGRQVDAVTVTRSDAVRCLGLDVLHFFPAFVARSKERLGPRPTASAILVFGRLADDSFRGSHLHAMFSAVRSFDIDGFLLPPCKRSALTTT